jgi:hypothetical protein
LKLKSIFTKWILNEKIIDILGVLDHPTFVLTN